MDLGKYLLLWIKYISIILQQCLYIIILQQCLICCNYSWGHHDAVAASSVNVTFVGLIQTQWNVMFNIFLLFPDC